MLRAVRRVHLALAFAFSLAVISVLTPSSARAHDAGQCRGRSSLEQIYANNYYYTAQSRCGTGWDFIGAAAIAARMNSDGNFYRSGIFGASIDVDDDDAGVSGYAELVPGGSYVLVGVHGASEAHWTANPPHFNLWGPVFSVGAFQTVPIN